ncbi:putative entry exclusion protein TrbK-alt [Tardiphaga sp.]
MLALAVASALRPPSGAPPHVARRAVNAMPADAIPDRCRSITMPDSGCDAAWEARRRHFFTGENR